MSAQMIPRLVFVGIVAGVVSGCAAAQPVQAKSADLDFFPPTKEVVTAPPPPSDEPQVIFVHTDPKPSRPVESATPDLVVPDKLVAHTRTN